MDWWQKVRRAWLVITAGLLKGRKNENEKCKNNNSGRLEASSSNNQSDTRQGFLKLQDDVETCEYEDVHVLWNLLNQAQAEEEEAVPKTCSSETNKKQQPQKHSWRAYFCPINHQPTSFALLSS